MKASWYIVSILLACALHLHAGERPNIVIILCDDLGYGDIQCLNPEGQIPTPRVDKLAAEGMIFTDAHSGSSVCTPTRYGIMTGRYSWRSRLKSGVLGGMSPRLIEQDRLTLPQILKDQGYHTACIGKWHLGMDWSLKTGEEGFDDTIEKGEAGWRVDYSKPIRNGPNSVGFDYFFGISASLDMVPYTYIENTRVTDLPVRDNAFPMMLGAKPQTRRGPAAAGFQAEDVLPKLTRKAVEYIHERSEEARSGKPFFLYFPLASPHTPIVPTEEWQGKSGLNPYGDFVMQTDWSVGQVLQALKEVGLEKDTLVIFTSDNGCSPQAGFSELKSKGHQPSYIFRGAKADIYEGGHRVPFIARWPGKIKPGTQTAQLVCLTDFMATCAEMLEITLPPNAAEDSFSFQPALAGSQGKALRTTAVHHSVNGSFAIRSEEWKVAFCPGSGGWSAPRPGSEAARGLPKVQLFNLTTDPGETTNLHSAHPEIVEQLTGLLEQIVEEGRSTPGEKNNTGEVHFQPARK